MLHRCWLWNKLFINQLFDLLFKGLTITCVIYFPDLDRNPPSMFQIKNDFYLLNCFLMNKGLCVEEI
jgi:hypothetical protein